MYAKIASRPEVRLIELKLSAGIKPVYPGDPLLRFEKPVEHTIGNSIFSDPANTDFRDAEGMIHFLGDLRELSGGKPIGIRLCINDKKEFYQICHAFRKTQIIPDFIVVEGPLESTGTLHADQAFPAGMPLYDALLFVSQTLQVYGLQDKIRVIADGKIFSCFDILKVLAMGANVVCTEMPLYTTIKYTVGNRKPSLHHENGNKNDFHDSLMKDTVQVMKKCGFKSVDDITLSKFFSRIDVLHSKEFEELDAAVLS
jgi:glutamate synthase domain-containing protein 2